MDKAPQVSLHSTAHYFLEGLNELGIEYLFCNLGTDHAPLIEEMARWRREGRKFPATLLCPHENTAMHMAAGYAMVTGRGQAVLVHVDAGTANAAVAAHNICRDRVPLLLMAGKAPYTVRGELPGSRDTYVHFIQEPFDQGAIVRNYVKWEWTLPSGVITKEVLRRAYTVAHSDPPGPVYLMLPRETLAQTWDASAVRSFPDERYGAARAGAADAAAIATIAERLLAAKYPILVTAYAGRSPRAPGLIEELARLAGIRVFEFNPSYLNISRAAPCWGGLIPGKHVAEADVGLLVDVDVPWIPRDTRENPHAWWAHIDVDVVKERFPIWGFSSHLRLPGDSVLILGQLLEALKARATPAFREAAAKRLEAMTREHAERRAHFAKLAENRGTKNAVNQHYLCAELGRALGENDILVNESIRNSGVVYNQVVRTRPGTSLGSAGGGLGFSAGRALGARLARPDVIVAQVVGDGSYYFGNPSSTYAVALQYRLPIFTVVLDNAGWSAVKEATLRMYPEGEAKSIEEFQARLAPGVDFARVCEAAGGYGEMLSDPDAVPDAIRRCLGAVRGGRPAVLHAKIPVL
ncbi:MAG: thiamine pyrophosphate-requiring protein [Burkholderiales bacterium]